MRSCSYVRRTCIVRTYIVRAAYTMVIKSALVSETVRDGAQWCAVVIIFIYRRVCYSMYS